MNVDSNGNMVVSPISARGQERLARLRATIAQKFGGANPPSSSRTTQFQSTSHMAVTTNTARNQRSKIRQRIEQASRMTSDEIFFKEFGSPKQLMALDFDLARTEHPTPRSLSRQMASAATATKMATVSQQSMPSHSMRTDGTTTQSRFDAIAQQTLSVRNTSTLYSNTRLASTQESTVVAVPSSYAPAACSNVQLTEPPAFVSQLQRPTQILTPKKVTLKRMRTAGDLPSAEKPPPAQKPRLLSDVTSSFNNRSFSNVGQVRGSGVISSVNSPNRKPPGFLRPTFLQQPSPSKFRVPPSTTRLFGQRQAPFR
uniref:Uncharacterized protein n=1 Tax=Globisporangium ultimum (strain ATCC 200006 / CBS 805.95 / DAOM BR144) TaxID=431595 RepID=K3WG50_GLOUD